MDFGLSHRAGRAGDVGSGGMNLWAIVPELIVACLCLLLVPVAAWVHGVWTRIPMAAALIGLAGAMIFTARMLLWGPVSVFDGTYAVDGLGTVAKLLIEAGAFITILLAGSYFDGTVQAAHAPVAILFATLGAMTLTSSMDLALIILFLEMMSMASYMLAALVRSDGRALEAALKYFLFGAVALAIMAYGLTFLYGLTGSLDLRVIGQALTGADRAWTAVALVVILAGYGFEITMAPFHFWAPDVFSGSTAPVAGFVSVVPKVAAMVGLLRLLSYTYRGDLANWPTLIAVLAALTMTLGNLLALRQTGLKRLLAYSTIAQAGYMLLAVATVGRIDRALPAAVYYLAAYLFMNLGAFAFASQLERAIGTDRLDTLPGLGRNSPGAAACLALFLFSLAGIPPLAGFAGKILLLEAAMAGGLTWLAVIAAANMVVALYYYVAVISKLYLEPPAYSYRLQPGIGYTVTYALTLAGTLALGILPGSGLDVVSLSSKLLR